MAGSVNGANGKRLSASSSPRAAKLYALNYAKGMRTYKANRAAGKAMPNATVVASKAATSGSKKGSAAKTHRRWADLVRGKSDVSMVGQYSPRMAAFKSLLSGYRASISKDGIFHGAGMHVVANNGKHKALRSFKSIEDVFGFAAKNR